MRTRWLTSVCVVVLVGTSLNVAIALTCAVAAQGWPGTIEPGGEAWSTVRQRVQRYEWPEIEQTARFLRGEDTDHHELVAYRAAQYDRFRSRGGRMVTFGYEETIRFVPTNVHGMHSGPLVIHVIEAGWPMKALHRGRIEVPRSVREVPPSFRQTSVPSTDAGGFMVPIRPLWRGFILNSLFYAAVLWMLFVMPPLVRRYRRARRGLCPTCAYPIGPRARCTECGVFIPPAARRLAGRLSKDDSAE